MKNFRLVREKRQIKTEVVHSAILFRCLDKFNSLIVKFWWAIRVFYCLLRTRGYDQRIKRYRKLPKVPKETWTLRKDHKIYNDCYLKFVRFGLCRRLLSVHFLVLFIFRQVESSWQGLLQVCQQQMQQLCTFVSYKLRACLWIGTLRIDFCTDEKGLLVSLFELFCAKAPGKRFILPHFWISPQCKEIPFALYFEF